MLESEKEGVEVVIKNSELAGDNLAQTKQKALNHMTSVQPPPAMNQEEKIPGAMSSEETPRQLVCWFEPQPGGQSVIVCEYR